MESTAFNQSILTHFQRCRTKWTLHGDGLACD
jgi:hypothetical protein